MEKFDARLKLQPISLRQVKIELKNRIWNRFYGISCEGPVYGKSARKMLISAF